MYDEIMKLDLDKLTKMRKFELSFVIFPDGRTVKVDSGSHSTTVVEYSRKYYPDILKEFKALLDKKISEWDNDVDDEEKEYYSSMIVLDGDFISRRLGIVLIHNNAFLFSDIELTEKQNYALNKLDDLFEIDFL